MADLTLLIGNKNYSSWSLRPWLALKATGAPFREELVALGQPDTQARIRHYSPAGRVPVLRDGDVTVWESLAICEYLAERFPASGLWPADRAARALARSISSEMHAGFAALRREMPMDIRARLAGRTVSAEAAADIERVKAIWRDAIARFGGQGPFLFGRFSIADCMYAPVATRFVTYGVPLDPVSDGYVRSIMDHPAMREWCAAAAAEAVPYH
jgi:glutathione S-transferase